MAFALVAAGALVYISVGHLLPEAHGEGRPTLATLLALAGWKINRVVGLLATAFLVVVQIASVHLGWHYAVDGYAGTPITLPLRSRRRTPNS